MRIGGFGAFLAIALAPVSIEAAAESREVIYAPPAEWVVPHPEFEIPETEPSGALLVRYSDVQTHLDGEGAHSYQAQRYKINHPEALAAGNVVLVWNPTTGSATVHFLRVHREGEVIDVLADQQFEIFQREGGLEQSMLDGLLTANLNIQGLRVGDELEFAATVLGSEPAFEDKDFGLLFLAPAPPAGDYRLRLSWAEGSKPNWKLTEAVSGIARESRNALEVAVRDPEEIPLPDGAPFRYMLPRLVEYTDFGDWQHVSSEIAVLFDAAAQLAPDSPVKREAARIAERHATPLARAGAALRLAQDSVRYIYVGMNGANLRPATADETWDRRYGDCKAKTVLLLALLKELGIEAEAVAVDSSGGDGIDQRLPNPGLFDHVLVRATIGGKQYWMDGTRQGDSRMLERTPTYLRWVLPLQRTGSNLEAIAWSPHPLPLEIDVTDIDSSAGFEQPGRMTMQRIVRGEDALQIRYSLSALADADAKRVVRSIFSQQGDWVDIDEASWRFDEATGAAVLRASGMARFDWEPDEDRDDEWVMYIPGAGFYPPPTRTRLADQDQAAPWTNSPDRYSCHVTTIRLPEPGEGLAWDYRSSGMDEIIGGIAYWRMAELRDRTMRTVMASRTMDVEISPEDAARANDTIPEFDNSQSYVETERQGNTRFPTDRSEDEPSVPAADELDWSGADVPCAAPDLLEY